MFRFPRSPAPISLVICQTHIFIIYAIWRKVQEPALLANRKPKCPLRKIYTTDRAKMNVLVYTY